MSAYVDFIRAHIAEGEDPNTITRGIEDAMAEAAPDWGLWGDGVWRLDKRCSICGSVYPGICGHGDDPQRKILLARELSQEPTA